MISITISIPAYNEANNIEVLIENVLNTISKDPNHQFYINVIDDGSTDNTPSILNKLSKEYPNITVYTHDKNEGFGLTIKEVFMNPTSDWILFLSGDNQFPASNIPIMMTMMGDYDLILGYRNIRQDNFVRKIISFIYNKFITILAHREIKDVSSIALVKTSLLKDVNLTSKSAFIHAEIIIKLLNNGANFIEIPVFHNERSYGKASGGKFITILRTIMEMVKFSINRI